MEAGQFRAKGRRQDKQEMERKRGHSRRSRGECKAKKQGEGANKKYTRKYSTGCKITEGSDGYNIDEDKVGWQNKQGKGELARKQKGIKKGKEQEKIGSKRGTRGYTAGYRMEVGQKRDKGRRYNKQGK